MDKTIIYVAIGVAVVICGYLLLDILAILRRTAPNVRYSYRVDFGVGKGFYQVSTHHKKSLLRDYREYGDELVPLNPETELVVAQLKRKRV